MKNNLKNFLNPFTGFLLLILGFLVFHIGKNNISEKEYNNSSNNQYAHKTAEFTYLVAKGTYKPRVLDIINGETVKRKHYVFDEDNKEIIEIAPRSMKTVKCSIWKRFFTWGIFNGDGRTVFTNKFWGADNSNFLGLIRLDPTNPTFFYLIIIMTSMLCFLDSKRKNKEISF